MCCGDPVATETSEQGDEPALSYGGPSISEGCNFAKVGEWGWGCVIVTPNVEILQN